MDFQSPYYGLTAGLGKAIARLLAAEGAEVISTGEMKHVLQARSLRIA